MSWEVRTMRSATSYFNFTLLRKNFARFWPILLEALPLTLEEIFIYELGGEDYAVRDIVL